MVAREFKLPDPGEGLVEAEIVTWRVAVGDQVAVNDILLEIETSKSIVELPSPYAGTVTALLAAEGDTVEVGRPIISVDDGVSVAPAAEPAAPAGAEAVATPAGGRVAMLVGYGPKTTEARRRPRREGHGLESAPAQAHQQFADTFSVAEPVSRRTDEREPLHPQPETPSAAPLPGPGPAAPEPYLVDGAVLAKPPVRKLAKDLGVDLTQLTGSGQRGVITRADVEAAAKSERTFPEPVEGPESPRTFPEPVEGPAPSTGSGSVHRSGSGDGDTRLPIKGVRKATAEAMVRSAFTAPHVTEWVTCDVSATVELVARLKERREFKGIRISPLLIVAKAVCLAISRTPQLNSFWDEAAQEIVLKSGVNLGIAAATPRGLVVPNIKGAQAMTLLELAEAINQVVATAREGRTQPAAMADGTFTITNVGTFGVDAGTPILNPGEAGILCIGQIARRPWVVGTGDDERIEPRWVTTLAVSFDHRLADGEQGSIFLATVAQTLSDPGLALLF